MLYLLLNLSTYILVYFFLLLTLNMDLSVEHRIKSTKQLKCTLKNGSFFKTCACDMSQKQHGLNNP